MLSLTVVICMLSILQRPSVDSLSQLGGDRTLRSWDWVEGGGEEVRSLGAWPEGSARFLSLLHPNHEHLCCRVLLPCRTTSPEAQSSAAQQSTPISTLKIKLVSFVTGPCSPDWPSTHSGAQAGHK